MDEVFKVRIKQAEDRTVECCSQLCTQECPHFDNCEQVRIKVLRPDPDM